QRAWWDRTARYGRSGAAKHRAHAGDDLARRKRFGDVVVGTGLESGDAIGLSIAAGEDDDRLPPVPMPNATDEIEAASVGEHEIEHDEIGVSDLAFRCRERCRDRYAEAVSAQREGERFGDSGFIFDDQDLGHGLTQRFG